MDKEKIVSLIKGRILDEYRKHQNLDWAEIAARKLYSQWDEFFSKNTLDGLPENMPLYKDSGLWQMRSDNMDEVIIQQGVNESDLDFLSRCKLIQTEMLKRLLSEETNQTKEQ